MTNEELYISNKMGKKNPFSTPEGYFDQFANQLMAKLPEKPKTQSQTSERTTKIRHLRPWMIAAACTALVLLGITAYFYKDSPVDSKKQKVAAAIEQENNVYYSDNYIEDEANYAMVDNQEIYACLLAEM